MAVVIGPLWPTGGSMSVTPAASAAPSVSGEAEVILERLSARVSDAVYEAGQELRRLGLSRADVLALLALHDEPRLVEVSRPSHTPGSAGDR